MQKFLFCAAVALVAAVPGAQAQTAGGDSYLGTIYTTANTYCPRGTRPAMGQIMDIQEYPALFSLFGTTYGGNGQSTFGLPDLRGRSPVGIGYSPSLSDIDIGERGGAETVSFNVPLPRHSHRASVDESGSATATLMSSSRRPTTYDPSGNYLATYPSAVLTYAEPGGEMRPMGDGSVTISVGGFGVTVDEAGTADATVSVPVRSPYLGLMHCVVTEGPFPPRD
jgi:microcystin-dependent protein